MGNLIPAARLMILMAMTARFVWLCDVEILVPVHWPNRIQSRSAPSVLLANTSVIDLHCLQLIQAPKDPATTRGCPCCGICFPAPSKGCTMQRGHRQVFYIHINDAHGFHIDAVCGTDLSWMDRMTYVPNAMKRVPVGPVRGWQ